MENKKSAHYRITLVTTSGYQGAETLSWPSLEMTGNDGSKTSLIDLIEENDPKFRNGEVNVFNVAAENVGLPILLRIELNHRGKKDPWGVQYINIKYGNEECHFPVHDWIEDEFFIARGKGQLQHVDCHPDVATMLDIEVQKNAALLPWARKPGPTDIARGLPRFVDAFRLDQIPLIFRPTEIWANTFIRDSVDEGVKAALKKLDEINVEFNTLESFEVLINLFEKGKERSAFLDRWKTDEEFGRQQLNGTSPLHLERCTKIPGCCQISENHVNGLLDGKTLQQRMNEGKIYISDFSEVCDGVKRNKNSKGELLCCPEVICLFYVNLSDNFVPIAIQLIPNDPQSIFTPLDSENDWLLAKMYYRVAFGNIHSWHYHFLLTHGVMESFSVALFRGLPRCHPVYKLLRPHLQTVTIINSLARATLIGAGSNANKALAIEGEDLVRKMFKTFHMRDLVIPDYLKRKGLDNRNLLPKFYYRDDALELWKIMEQYVRDIISVYYDSDQIVAKDKHLQECVKDFAEQGIGWEDGDIRGVKYPLTTIEDLVNLCTVILFTSSAQHAAINFPQFEMYKFIPNAPLGMRLPPHRKGEATLQRILDSLPDKEMSLISMAVAASLSTYSADEVYIGNYPVKLFVDPLAEKAIKKYKKSLDKYAEDIKERNKRIEYPYIWLLPEKVPNSISI